MANCASFLRQCTYPNTAYVDWVVVVFLAKEMHVDSYH